MIVHLSAFDILHCALFAERQRCIKRALGVSTRKRDATKGEYELHLLGAIGELAAARALGVSLDYATHPIGDNGVDLAIHGWTIQVKTFTYTAAKIEFFMDSLDDFKADAAIGVQLLSLCRARIMGVISRQRFTQKHQLRDYGYGARPYVPEAELSSIRALVDSERADA